MTPGPLEAAPLAGPLPSSERRGAPTDVTAALGRGQLTRPLLRLAAPTVASGLLKSSFVVVDTWCAGQVSTLALTGLTAAVFFGWMFHSLASMVSIGALSRVAQATGRGDRALVRDTLAGACAWALRLGTGVSLAFFLAAPFFVSRLGLPASAAADAADYLRVLALFGPAYWFLDTLEQGFRASGDARRPLVVTTVAALANLVLNPVLALGWGPVPALGLVGIGLATGLAWLFGAIALAAMAHGRLVDGWGRALRPHPRIPARTLLSVGLPVALTGLSFDLVWTVVTPWITATGPVTLAAIGVGHRLESLGYLAGAGMGHACAALVGMSIGLQRPDLARRVASRAQTLGMALVGTWGACLLLFSEPLYALFSHDDDVRALGALYLVFAALPMTFQALESVSVGAFEGRGHTWRANAISLTCYAARVPLILLWAERGPVAVFAVVGATASAAGLLVAAAHWQVGRREGEPARAAGPAHPDGSLGV